MTVRFYILPIVDIGNGRQPKYIKVYGEPVDGIYPARWAMKDYGLIDAALMAADVTQEQHEALVTEIDVAAVPTDIDQAISVVALPTVQNIMEALRIPAGWVTTSHTYREILRMIGGLFILAQRHHGMHNEQLIDSTAQLDLRWNQIPQDRQDRIKGTASSFGYDYNAVQPTWLIRQILKYLGDQWGQTPILFGFVTL